MKSKLNIDGIVIAFERSDERPMSVIIINRILNTMQMVEVELYVCDVCECIYCHSNH